MTPINWSFRVLPFSFFAGALAIAAVGVGARAAEGAGSDEQSGSPQVYKKIGDRKLSVVIDYPPDWKPGDRRPAIVFFFGGGWTGGSLGQFGPQARYFAKRGMVCLRVDYRVRARDGVWPDECVRDARSAMRWTRANAARLGIDPDRIASSGGSAGGHLSLAVHLCDGIDHADDDLAVSPHPNAIVAFNPALDLTRLKELGHAEKAKGIDEATQIAISPLRQLREDLPPTLIIDGTKDFFHSQNREFVEKAKQMGLKIEALWEEGKPHGYFNHPPFLGSTTQRMDEFFQSLGYLGTEPKVALPSEPARK